MGFTRSLEGVREDSICLSYLWVAVATNHRDVNRNCRHPHFHLFGNPEQLMADITKCTNESCIIRKGCYRWTAPADPIWQAYSRFEPFHNGDYYTCEHYTPDHKKPVHTNHPFTDREQGPNVNE